MSVSYSDRHGAYVHAPTGCDPCCGCTGVIYASPAVHTYAGVFCSEACWLAHCDEEKEREEEWEEEWEDVEVSQ